ncbi:hypothetical protein [Streptomyces sp. NPDC058280]|uniref:hypothetical protein n=1 Tax=Streptomyces sp. NPDC058280 TaxID=3346419 RepID=UPI0036EFD838
MDDETPTMDVTLWATLDELAAEPRGDLLVQWFRTAVDTLFPAESRELAGSKAVVAESLSGGRDFRVPDVRANWRDLADALRGLPLHASAAFHEPHPDDGSWVDHFGRIEATRVGRGGSHSELSVAVFAADRISDPAYCSGLVDFLATALDGANPAFARIDHLNFHDTTDLEAVLRRPQRKSLREARTLLRGYSWVTGVPAELAARLGGARALEATFHAVRELPGGGLLLQATETLAGYDKHRMHAVFRALAPVLPPGMPDNAPARPDPRVVFEDAGEV